MNDLFPGTLKCCDGEALHDKVMAQLKSGLKTVFHKHLEAVKTGICDDVAAVLIDVFKSIPAK